MMAPLPPLANTLKVSAGWYADLNQTAVSILHFQYTGGPPSTSDCQALAATMQAAAVTQFKSLVSTSNKIGPFTVLDIGSTSGAQGSGGTATAGTRTGNAVAAGTAFVMQHQIARRYRGGKPRSYTIFGTSSDLASTGTWQSSLLTSAVTAWSAFITSCLAATSGTTVISQYGSVSYYTGHALRPTPHWDPIVASTARTRVGSQRRRNKTA